MNKKAFLKNAFFRIRREKMRKFLLTIMTSLSLISTTDVLAADVQQCYRINRETQSNAITQGNVVMLDI